MDLRTFLLFFLGWATAGCHHGAGEAVQKQAVVTPRPGLEPTKAGYDRAAHRVRYRRQTVDGLEIFYREAGDPAAPTVLLLHGFPSSSHMFRDLIPMLSRRYHVL